MRTNATERATQPEDGWFARHLRQVHVDFHMPEFPADAITRFDAREFVAEFVRAHVNVIGVFTKCHFGNAFYDNSVGHRHSGLKQDFFGEVLEEAHRHGIKVIAYYSLGTDAYAVEHNPDWYQIDENGEKRGGHGTVWELPCINSPYREELVIPQVKEITEKYAMDGYLFDIPYLKGHTCFCTYCKKRFKEQTGRELTKQLYETERDTVMQFGVDSAARCMRELYDLVKSIRPEVLVNCNGAWKMGEPDAINETSDYGLWESQPASGTFLCHSFRSRYVRNLPVPVQIMTVRFTEGWGLMSCKTAEQLKYECAAIMANGGIINIGDQVLPNGKLQSGVYDVIGEAFAFVKEREAACIGATSVKHMALIAHYPGNWYYEPPDAATLGAAKMLIEGHHQFDIFYNDDFPDLAAYQIVVLPETVLLSEASAQRLREFVRRGGLLLAAGEASLRREPVAGFVLADVLGVEYLDRTPYPFAYLTEHEALWKGTAVIPQLLEGPFLKVKPSTAETLSRIQWPLTVPAPQRAFRHPIPPAGRISEFPAVTTNRYGEGQAMYVAAPIFATYWKYNHFWLRRIVNNALDLMDTGKPFSLAAPATVEANMMENGGRRYLHLINFQNGHTGSRKEAFYDPIECINPIYDIVVRFPAEAGVAGAVQLPEGVPLPVVPAGDGGGVAVTVPKLHIHTMLELH
ncbi:alpha-L-fucosidase [Paenibacillus cymbidii]|uniref:alpha-L-fucosidase n=1 Tax=Paenibacillus cymbidii TaxID=1639034 RepID=UPI001080F3ED|nr:alpha-L-fucosidase [Paenibacillus cymbidii]